MSNKSKKTPKNKPSRRVPAYGSKRLRAAEPHSGTPATQDTLPHSGSDTIPELTEDTGQAPSASQTEADPETIPEL